MKNKVLIVAPVHDLNDVRVFKKQAISLANTGYEVELIANAEKHQVISGVSVIPAWGTRSNRVLRFLSIPFIALQIISKSSDIVHFHNPDTIPLLLVCKLLGRKVIYDTHEDFSERIMMRKWIPTGFKKLFRLMVKLAEKFAYLIADRTIVTQEQVAVRFGDNCLVIGNPPRFNNALLGRVQSKAEKITKQKDVFRVIYLGTINEQRGLMTMLEALCIVNDCVEVRLWLVGPADKDDLAVAKKHKGWRYVDYIPKVEQETAFAYVSLSDVGLIVIRDLGDHKYTDPNKIYEYMAFGKPFIASNFPHWKEKFEALGAGIFVKPSSADSLANAISELSTSSRSALIDMGQNGRQFIKTNNWENESKKLIDLYETLLERY